MQTLISGTWAEDFNYGYPYLRKARILPPEFSYSGEVISARGKITSTTYARSAFAVQYLYPSADPNNLDSATHGGANALAPYYLLFPLMQWGETQMITLKIVLSADGNLTYDRNYDGYAKDRFSLFVNGHERATVTHTAGHHWVTDTILLRKGTNIISWVMQCAKYVAPTVRNGVAVTATAPKLSRYFRLCRFTIQNVAGFPGGTTGYQDPPVYCNLDADLTGTTLVGRRGARAGLLTMKSYGYVGYKAKNGSAVLSATAATSVVVQNQAQCGPVLFLCTAAFGQTGNVQFSPSANETIMTLSTTAALTVEVPFNTVPSIVPVPLQTVSMTMQTPIFVNGKPIIPKYQDVQTTNVATAGGYTYADAVNPTSVNHVLPVTSTYRWVATDIIGADDSQVLDWPEHSSNSNPHWLSTAAYGPHVLAHEQFNDLTWTTTNYARVLNFYSHNVEHMWMTMPATAFPITVTSGTAFQPYTWTFVGMLKHLTGLPPQGNTLIDAYPNSQTPADYTANIQNDDNLEVADGLGAYRSIVRITPNQMLISNNTANNVPKPWVYNYKPCVYTVVFNGAYSAIIAYGQNYYQRVNMNTGAGSNYNVGFMLGRLSGYFHRSRASTMALMEVAFHNRALTSAEIKTNANYLMGVYQVEKYH